MSCNICIKYGNDLDNPLKHQPEDCPYPESVVTRIVESARLRHWRSGDHVPYPGILHDKETDEKIDWKDKLLRLLWSVEEGSTISIDVTITKPINIDPDDYWTLLEPHTYGHVRNQK